MKKRGWILPSAAALALVAAFVSIARTQPRREAADPPAAPPASPFETTIAAVGLIEPASESLAIGSHLTGVVASVAARTGAQVTRGALLFTLDARNLEAELDARAARLVQTEAELAAAHVAAAHAAALRAFAEAVVDPDAIAAEELATRRFAAEESSARVRAAEAAVEVARAALAQARVELTRSEVRAPIDGVILKVDVRPGEAVAAGASARALLLMGQIDPLHVRVDVDEHESWRVTPDARARAFLRGQTALQSELSFVRIEPYVLPKRSLTGDGTERVDTRVLQVIYRLDDADARWFVGQQVDVFVEGARRAEDTR